MNGNLGASNTIIHEAGLTVQPPDENLKMDAVLSESLSDGKASRKRTMRSKRKKKKPTNIDEVPSIDQPKIEEGSIKYLTEGNENEKRNKKLKSKNAKSKDEVQCLVQNNMDTTSAMNLAEGGVTIEAPKVKDEVQSADQTRTNTRSTKILAEGNVTIRNLKIQDRVQSMGQTIMDTAPTENSAEVHVTGKRKKKRKCVTKINVEVQREVDTGSIKNLAEGNVTIKNPSSRDDAQSIGQTNMDIGSGENLDEVNVVIKNPKVQDDVQSMDQTKMGTGPTENAAELHVTRKRKSKAKINVEVQRVVVTRSIENFVEGNVTIEKPKNRKNMSRKRKRKRKRKIKDEVQSDINTRPTENLAEGYLTAEKLKTTMDEWSIENLSEGNVTTKNLKIQDEAQIMDQTKVETGPAQNSAEGKIGKRKRKPKRKRQINYESPSVVETTPTKKLAEGNVSIDNPNIQDEAQSTDQTKMEAVPTESSAKGSVSGKRKRNRKSGAKIKDEVLRVVHTRQTENLAAGNVTIKKPMIYEEVQSVGLTKMDTVSTENLADGNEAHSKDQTEVDRGPTENSAEANVSNNRKRKQNRKKKAKIKAEASRKMDTRSTENLPEENVTIKLGGDCISNCDSLASPMELEEKLCPNESQNGLSDLCNEIILEKGKGYAEGISATAISTSDIRGTMDFSSFNVKDAKEICPSAITPVRRKLLVLDVNGLLADIVYSAPKHCRGDIKIFGRAVFKRPFCDDFLKFCFQNFDVGIWSSRSKKIIVPVVNYLLGNQKDKLLFCWDMDHATKTKFNTLENKHKPLVCKELSKIWENDACNLSWKKGDYDESNTLLLDDSPYKALLNPLNTAIFPSPYQYDNENDDSLGPGGNLRVYLEGLVTAENVQKYVEQHPFGQSPITEEHCSWDFYSKVLHQVSKAVEGKTSMPNPVEGKTSTPSPVEGKTLKPNLVEGKTLMPSPVEGKTLTPNPVEGKTLRPSPVEGKTLIPNPVEGKTLTPNPV